MNKTAMRSAALTSVALLATPLVARAAAIDDIKLESSRDLCSGAGATDENYIVYATNVNSTQSVDATFKYDSVPARQHFILFDADLNPITDRFPKLHSRRLRQHESVQIGCSFTYRAASAPPGPQRVPLIISTQSAAYVDANSSGPPAEDARAFAALILQGGISECGPGAKPPGLFFLVNLHPFAKLSASLNWPDDRGTRAGKTLDLPPFSVKRLGCSNGPSKPGPISSATLELPPAIPANSRSAAQPESRPPALEQSEPRAAEIPPPAALSLGQVLRTQNICAGPVPPGWIKINDAWNPTVCGKPSTITYNVWIIQELTDQPLGAVVYACRGAVPAGWAMVGSSWNPTVCGHPSSNQPNVMAIKRLN